MKLVGNILFIMTLCFDSYGQTVKGGRINGGNLGAGSYDYERSLGLTNLWLPTVGVNLIGTNVQQWNSIVGQRSVFEQFMATNQPTQVQFGTNILGHSMNAIFFETNAPNVRIFMKCNSISTNWTGTNIPITMLMVVNSQCTDGNSTELCFGYTGATNFGADRMGLRLNNAADQNTFFKGCATNQSPPSALVSVGASLPTNQWGVITVQYNGTTLFIWNGLSRGTGNNLSAQTFTRTDLVTLGMIGHTNTLYTKPARFALGEFQLYQRSLSPQEVTNVVLNVNARYNLGVQ